MELVSNYKANDGRIFSSKEECIKYEKVLQQANDIIKNMGELPEVEQKNFRDKRRY